MVMCGGGGGSDVVVVVGTMSVGIRVDFKFSYHVTAELEINTSPTSTSFNTCPTTIHYTTSLPPPPPHVTTTTPQCARDNRSEVSRQRRVGKAMGNG
jgi:hypothetical protein